eukprot:1621995-Amphidinium_carterae.1
MHCVATAKVFLRCDFSDWAVKKHVAVGLPHFGSSSLYFALLTAVGCCEMRTIVWRHQAVCATVRAFGTSRAQHFLLHVPGNDLYQSSRGEQRCN